MTQQDPAHMRASDQDRERVAEILRDAAGEGRLDMGELDERLEAVYSAKTYAELEPITHDLPRAGSVRTSLPVPAAPASPDRYGGQPSSTSAVAILGGFSRRGSWVVPPAFTAVAFMGGGTIDMRDARFAERTVTIHTVAIMAGIEIIVPEDAQVDVTGFGFMGAYEHDAVGEGQPDGPIIRVNGLALMGGVEVKRKPPTSAAKLAKIEAKRQKQESRELRSRSDDD